MMDKPTIQDGAGLGGGRWLRFDTLDSTNAWALAHAGELRHGDVVQAVRQTAGRGRLGRSWAAPADRALTLSVALRETPAGLRPHNLTQVAALAVRDLLADERIACALKWPNDVFASGFKICGILAETDPTGACHVVGIGLNVNLSDADFAGLDLRQPATSMMLQRGDLFDVAGVGARLIGKLAEVWRRLATSGMAGLRAEWAAHDGLAHQRVRVTQGDAILTGRYTGLGEGGFLTLVDDAGQPHTVQAGDLERLGPA